MLAHGTGLDEFAIFFFPAAFGVGLWLITRKKKDTGGEGGVGSAGAPSAREDVTQIANRRKDGAARLRAVMHEADPPAAVAEPAPRRRPRRLAGPARLRLLINGEDPSVGDAAAAED